MAKSPETKALPTVATIYGQIDAVSDSLARLPDEVTEAATGGVVELARAMVALRGLKDHIDGVLKPFEAMYAKVKDVDLPAKFEEAQIPSITLEEGFRVSVAHNIRAAVKGGMKDDAIAWLRNNGLADIVSETINASTLSAVARTMTEENRELDSELFNVYILPTTSVTKTKK